MYSGCAVIDKENRAGFGKNAVLLYYTAAGSHAPKPVKYTQRLAYSTDGLNMIIKYDGKIVFSVTKDNGGACDFNLPFIEISSDFDYTLKQVVFDEYE